MIMIVIFTTCNHDYVKPEWSRVRWVLDPGIVD